VEQWLSFNHPGRLLPMLFLLNDSVFSLDGIARSVRLSGQKFKGLPFPSIIRMGQEMYSREPLLQHSSPGQALRLAALISAKAPLINAALFVAPDFNCPPGEVTVRFVNVQFEVMADLYTRQRAGKLDGVVADRQIWRRLAA
jgi:hypothetical protein